MPDSENVRTGGFARYEHIKKPLEFRTLFKKGMRTGVTGAKLFWAANDFGYNRIAFPLPRGYGTAVERNRSKRLSREAYRLLKSHLNTGFDILFLVYPGNDSFHSRCEQLRKLCEKAGLLQ